ncbi:uncharacterized protein [Cherax quadricarinatus]
MSIVEESELVRLQDNIAEAHVKAALTADEGSEAKLISWSVEDFTNKGDNYATIVTSVSVKFSLLGKKQSSSYVVKLLPHWSYSEGGPEFGLAVFEKESEFFKEILPVLNYELTSLGFSPLRVAKWFYTSLEKEKEMIFLEDLHPRGFQMFDRKKGLSVAHATLVLQELARLHAASLLLKAKAPTEDLADRFTHIKTDWMTFSDSAKAMINGVFSGSLNSCEHLLHNIKGYEVAEQWIAKHKDYWAELIQIQLARNPKFDVICHGDCWNNNMLFRYNKEGDPVEVMLLDLQLNRVASPATDLNYFLYTSLHGHDRKANCQYFLSSYYDTFRGMMEAGRRNMPFTLEELRQEYKDKMEYGIIFGAASVPFLLGESKDAPDLINMKEENVTELSEAMQLKTQNLVENNPLFRSRVLAIFDELIKQAATKSLNCPDMSSVEESELVRLQDNITEAHVKAALTADEGSEAKLISWSVEDFTNKGDNYATIVTSVSVKFSLLGKKQSSSYVVKLLPKWSFSEDAGKFGLAVFKKESEFFKEILPVLNYELTSLGFSPLRVAKWFYTSLEKEKEMIFLEDLRPRGFQMFDRRKGLSVAHATLVLQELARLHAASLLLKARAPTEDLADRFTHLKTDWMTFSDSAKGMINGIFSAPLKSSQQLLHNIKGYEVAEQWIAKHKDNLAELIEIQLARNTKFDVICHGDCWNNNMLFRYNKEGDPVEVMLLDLQLNRVASPATDLSYLLYTSLHGRDRQANWQDFLSSYYDTFRGVMDYGRRSMPFTMEELRQEYKEKMEYGILFAAMSVPFLLGENKDAPDMINMKEENIAELSEALQEKTQNLVENNPLCRSRFLAIFDELIEQAATKSLNCPEEAELVRPQKNITEIHVKAALMADKGSEAKLISWSIEDFTNKGDNYATIVTSVSVLFSLLGKEQSLSYVVKLCPQWSFSEDFTKFGLAIFKKESEFFEEILPVLNYELTALGFSPLRVAKFFYSSLEKEKEMIFLEDLRPRGFQMFDRKKGLSVAHATLVLQELARLHAASLLLKARSSTEDLADRFTHIKIDWMNFSDCAKSMLNQMFSGPLKSSEQLLHNIKGYEVAEQWIAKHKDNWADLIEIQLARNPKFDVICHGDCWNNNMLFRYNKEGDPVEVMLLDLQLNRVASPATDLNYFLYTSLHGHDRKANCQYFLSSYYDTFRGVMEAGGRNMPFTQEELLQEYKDKMEYGMIFSAMSVPVLLCESKDAPDLINMKEENLAELSETLQEKTQNLLENNPQFRSRFLVIFDELIQQAATKK